MRIVNTTHLRPRNIRADSVDAKVDTFFCAAVCYRRQLDDSMKWKVNIRQLVCYIKTPNHLMSYEENCR